MRPEFRVSINRLKPSLFPSNARTVGNIMWLCDYLNLDRLMRPRRRDRTSVCVTNESSRCAPRTRYRYLILSSTGAALSILYSGGEHGGVTSIAEKQRDRWSLKIRGSWRRFKIIRRNARVAADHATRSPRPRDATFILARQTRGKEEGRNPNSRAV